MLSLESVWVNKNVRPYRLFVWNDYYKQIHLVTVPFEQHERSTPYAATFLERRQVSWGTGMAFVDLTTHLHAMYTDLEPVTGA